MSNIMYSQKLTKEMQLRESLINCSGSNSNFLAHALITTTTKPMLYNIIHPKGNIFLTHSLCNYVRRSRFYMNCCLFLFTGHHSFPYLTCQLKKSIKGDNTLVVIFCYLPLFPILFKIAKVLLHLYATYNHCNLSSFLF